MGSRPLGFGGLGLNLRVSGVVVAAWEEVRTTWPHDLRHYKFQTILRSRVSLEFTVLLKYGCNKGNP